PWAEEVSGADPRRHRGSRGVDMGGFAEHVAIADLDAAAAGRADGDVGVEDVALSDGDRSLNGDARAESASGADADMRSDDAERADLDVLGDGRSGIHEGRGVGLHSMSSSGSGGGADGAGEGRRISRRRPMWPRSDARRNSTSVRISGNWPPIFSTSASASGFGSADLQMMR